MTDPLNPATAALVLVTANSKEQARLIARTLVEEKLAACVNIFPISSVYRWESKVTEDDEWQLFIKCRMASFELLTSRVKALHSYTTPEIIALPFAAVSPEYLQWLANETQQP